MPNSEEKTPKEIPIRRTVSNKKPIKENALDLMGFKGYVLYFYDITQKNCEIYPLVSIQPVLKIRATGETFNLNKPAFYLKGKPVFIVSRNFPISRNIFELKIWDDVGFTEEEITEKLKKMKKRTIDLLFDEGNMALVERGYSASDIDAKTNSTYIQKFLKVRKVPISYVIVTITLIIIAILGTILIQSAVTGGGIFSNLSNNSTITGVTKIGSNFHWNR